MHRAARCRPGERGISDDGPGSLESEEDDRRESRAGGEEGHTEHIKCIFFLLVEPKLDTDHFYGTYRIGDAGGLSAHEGLSQE